MLKGRALSKGKAEGEAIVSKNLFGWLGGINPKSGEIVDERTDIYGKSLKGKVFIYPYGRGSTTGAAVFLESVRNKVNPVALVNIEMEPITTVGVLLAPLLYNVKIPAIDRLDKDPTEVISTGDLVLVDGDRGIVEVIKRK